jgi:hypothetical protein
MLASSFADPEAAPLFGQLLEQVEIGKTILHIGRDFSELLRIKFARKLLADTVLAVQRAEDLIRDWDQLTPEDLMVRHHTVFTELGEVLDRLRSTGVELVGVGAFAAVGTIRLHVLFQQPGFFPEQLHLFRGEVADLGNHVMSMVNQIREEVAPRYAIESIYSSPGVLVLGPEMCEYRIDGNLVGRFPRGEAFERQKQDLHHDLESKLIPLAKIVEEWRVAKAEDSIRQAYWRVLERPAEEAEIAGFLIPFRAGRSERTLIRELAVSAEHRKTFIDPNPPRKRIEVLFDHLLACSPEPEEIDAWVGFLQQSGVETVIDRLLDSPEYRESFGEYQIPGQERAERR